MTVLRNNGYGEFEDPVQFDATGNPGGLSLGDIDGDGKIDIAACLVNVNLGIFKNLSTSGIISLAPKSDYSPIQVTGQYLTAIADFNGDGKNDVLVTSPSDTALKIYINKIKPEPFIQSFSDPNSLGPVMRKTSGSFLFLPACCLLPSSLLRASNRMDAYLDIVLSLSIPTIL